ncbi:MAG: hypothetical protein A3I75_00435 [Deltaproteobacteria bacterium RIFCSPLOWO2_02_FULL_50_16]|nr:MAG: hypothetical protein A3B79_05630 [Deltaproteobacteria bacterium RIFCSPHIGHO2_02_FULL_50_15]OGQ58514.1 MAG: hypothetical protein A3I75_00435 [Deltaproteobacteria bacterium RIFCSPLOWO2_02_FULL_50_16]OGQ67962.1 MAG: hypothetical protein A3F89_03545 [Deltaproteobacteria bacterium RIFCSPLOWO2_12_FULL_50_11]
MTLDPILSTSTESTRSLTIPHGVTSLVLLESQQSFFQIQPPLLNTPRQIQTREFQLQEKIYTFSKKTLLRLEEVNQRLYFEREKTLQKIAELQKNLLAIEEDPSKSAEEKEKESAKIKEEIGRLEKKLWPPIDLAALTEKVEAIAADTALSEKEKRSQIDALRQEAGLKKGEMKDLVTGRLKEIYDGEKKEIESVIKNNPPTTLEAQQQLGLYYQRLDAHHSLYKSMYRSWWSQLGGFFKGALKFFGKGLLKIAKSWLPSLLAGALPGIGPALAPLVRAYQMGKQIYDKGKKIYNAGKKVVDTLRGDFSHLKKWALGKVDQIKDWAI